MNLLFENDRRGRYPSSWYAATAITPDPFPSLEGEVRADVCVVGGGFTGLSTALHLAGEGLDVVLVEAHRVGFGASGRNGGQVGSGQRLEQNQLEELVGRDAARKLWDLGEEAKALIRDLIGRHRIDARWRPGVAHAVYSDEEVSHEHQYAEKLATEYAYGKIEPLDTAGIRALIGSRRFKGGVVDWGAGHIHPLRFAFGLARAAAGSGVRIHEGTLATRITPGPEPKVTTEHGSVRADHVVIAANGYLGKLDGRVASRVMPINNFIVATEPLGDRANSILSRDLAVADSKFVVNYWRLSEDRRLLFGGGESYGPRFPDDIISLVRKPMLRIYPQLAETRIDYAWGGTLAITRNRMPVFANPRPGIWSASGYSGHGVAMATLAGRIIARAISGETTDWDTLAKVPSPRFPGGARLRRPLLALAMGWYALRDRLGG